MGKTHQKRPKKEPKTKDINTANINHSPKSVRSGDQGDCTTESHRYSTTKVYTISPRVRTEQLKKQRLTGRVSQTMGRQRNNPQMKGKEEVSETMPNEKEANQLSDVEFKEVVIRKLNELTQNYQKLQGNYNELTANYNNMKKEIETVNKGQEETKNTISELKNTGEGIKSRLDEAEDPISKLQDEVEKHTQNEQEKQKRLRKNEEGLREMQKNMNAIISV